jgi:NAD(P)-dependent dehydrogenase (short-subunit alcohol dehydrogenase family)
LSNYCNNPVPRTPLVKTARRPEAIVMKESQSGRVSLVTGGTEGIGRFVALELARRGDRVLITGRDQRRGEGVLAELRALAPELKHEFLPADLALLSQTAHLADQTLAVTERLDAVVCCAGLLATRPEWTAEGLERTLVVNYLSRYLLVRRLLPLLGEAPSGRVVLVANAGKYPDTLDFDDLQERRGVPGLRIAGRSQFANDLLALELARRVAGSRLAVSCVFPGLCSTRVFWNARHLPLVARLLLSGISKLFGLRSQRAAATPAFLAHAAEAGGENGSFWGPRLRRLPIPERAQRRDRQAELWRRSEELVAPYSRPARPSADDDR